MSDYQAEIRRILSDALPARTPVRYQGSMTNLVGLTGHVDGAYPYRGTLRYDVLLDQGPDQEPVRLSFVRPASIEPLTPAA